MTADLSKWLDRVTCGDCLDVLRELPDCSVDLCATDPPYALSNGPGAKGGFMGKAWDAALPARAIWAEVLRVLKPGASCFVCAGSRQDTILGLLTDLREVGFDIQHAALSWVYWNGFPKSTDVGKDFDKASFLKWVKVQPLVMLPECPFEHKHKGFAARKVECPECKRRVWALRAGYSDEVTRADVRKAASAAVNGCASDPRVIGTSVTRIEQGIREYLTTGDRSHGTLLLAALQARFGDAPGVRQKVGEYVHPSLGPEWVKCASCRKEYESETFGRDTSGRTITSPATPEAVEWDGWHSGSVPLKPSSETVLWVTKPAEPGPARNNVKRWGTGAVNVDGCRVPFATPEDARSGGWGAKQLVQPGRGGETMGNGWQHGYTTVQDQAGRYPSNLLVTARALGDDSRYGDLDAWASEHGVSDEWMDAALSAGVLRVPKPSRSEKNAGCEGLEERDMSEVYNGGMEGASIPLKGSPPPKYRNHHPTTKPVTLFAFLCTLACPRGGVVLDPFGGSGTTGVAAIDCGMHWVLIEREAEYVTIAEARIAAARRAHQPALALEVAQ